MKIQEICNEIIRLSDEQNYPFRYQSYLINNSPLIAEALLKAISALDLIYHELGVSQPGYPAPVANASDITRDTLKELEKMVK